MSRASYFVNFSGRDGRAQEGVEGPAAEQCNPYGQSENSAGTGTVSISKDMMNWVVEVC